MTPSASPLNDDHLSQINSAMDHIQRAEAQIILAKQAGIDVAQAEQSLNESKTKLLAIRRTYFPNR